MQGIIKILCVSRRSDFDNNAQCLLSLCYHSFTESHNLSNLVRFGVSIDQDLLEEYDKLISSRGYGTRSEALRDLIRDTLIQHKISTHGNVSVIGSLTIVYDHHAGNLLQEMAHIQHNYHELIISVMHLHVSHDDCMEILALKGSAGDILRLSYGLTSLKGVKNGKVFLTLPSSDIA